MEAHLWQQLCCLLPVQRRWLWPVPGQLETGAEVIAVKAVACRAGHICCRRCLKKVAHLCRPLSQLPVPGLLPVCSRLQQL